jgi:signal transduction histidine kinase
MQCSRYAVSWQTSKFLEGQTTGGFVVTTTTGTAPHATEATSYKERLKLVSGERTYAIARLLVVVLLFGLALLVLEREVWPVALDGDPFVLVLWAYAASALLLLLLSFIPPLHSLLSLGYIVDVLALSGAAFTSGAPSLLFFPFYLLPVAGMTLRYGALIGSVCGIFASASYVGSAFGTGGVLAGGPAALAPLDYASLGLQALILPGLAILIGVLADQWNTTNRQNIEQARRQADQSRSQIQDIRNQMSALYTTASTLTTTMKGERVLDALLSEGQHVVSYTVGLALLPKRPENPLELVVTAGHGLSLVDPGVVFSATRGSPIATALFPPGDPQQIADISQEADAQSVTTLRGCKAACIIPLRIDVKIYGLTIFARQTPDAFTTDEMNMLTALTNYAAVALLNKELDAEVKQEHISMIIAEERARHWLAREIHDSLAQKLAAIVMNADFLKRMIEHDPDSAIAEVDKLADIFKRANFDVRTLLGELKPTTLETKGLPAALEEYLERLRFHNEKVKIVLDTRNVTGMTLEKEVRSTLFNIVQESVNNALKYAEPQNIWVTLEREGYRLTITIQDDGKGFNVEESKSRAKARGSYGLSNLHERARLVNGVTDIVSAPGQGATIRVTVPLDV